MELICEHKKCTGCSLCHDVCKHRAIEIKENKHGFILPVIDYELCIDCGLCKKMCPVNNENTSGNKLNKLSVYEAWANDDSIRENASSGGVFGQIAYENLKKGGIVIGAAFDGLKAFHTAISSLEELPRIQDTKYVQSYAQESYKATYNYLKEGKNVVFSGTPCQVAACKSFLNHKNYTGNLLTVELVCHGVPSYLALKKAIEYNDAKRVVHFRDKSKGWGYHSQRMCYETGNGNYIFKNREDDLFYRMFFSEKLLRPSCSSCPFAQLPRVADITIGDSWGTNNKDKNEIKKGLSLVLINNPIGEEWIKKSNIKLRQTSILDSLYINRNVYTPFPPSELIQINHDICGWVSKLNVKEYMNQNALGFNEILRKESYLSKTIRDLNEKIRRRFLKVYDLSDINIIKLLLLEISYKINSFLNPKPSERYLSKKFLVVIKSIYKAKK